MMVSLRSRSIVASTIVCLAATEGVVGWASPLVDFRVGRHLSQGFNTDFTGRRLILLKQSSKYDDDDDEPENVPVPRRGRAGRGRSNDVQEDPYYDGPRSSSEKQKNTDRYYDNDEYYDDEEDWEDDDDEEDDEFDDLGVDYDLLSDVVIPNPLLDSIDPDGAAERFPELARDPRFWLDVVLFLAFINFLSDIGPRDPNFFPWDDFPWQTL